MYFGRFLFLPIAATLVLGESAETTAPSLVARSVTAMDANWEQAPNYSFVERDLSGKKDAEWRSKTFEVTMIDGSPYRRLLAVNDHPVASAVAAEEKRKLEAETQKRQNESTQQRSRRLEKYRKERTQDQAMMQNMAQAFTFRPAGEEVVDGHPCLVFDAEPKREYRPPNRETKVFTGMRGRLWIDKAQHQWVKVEAEVFKSVSFYGFFAKVGPGTRFELEQEPVSGEIWLPKHFKVQVKASALGFIDESSSEDETYRDYRPIAGNSAQMRTTRP
jgi:hypothetical protein